jgi:hypothetical protein
MKEDKAKNSRGNTKGVMINFNLDDQADVDLLEWYNKKAKKLAPYFKQVLFHFRHSQDANKTDQT